MLFPEENFSILPKQTMPQSEKQSLKVYQDNRRSLEVILDGIHDKELDKLKNATIQLLQYVDQHPKFITKSHLSQIIESLCELLSPSDKEDPTRVTIHTQKLRFDPRLVFLNNAVKYDYKFESSKKYSNFAQYVDEVSGARRKMNEHAINHYFFSSLICLGISLSIVFFGLALVGSFPILKPLIWGSFSILFGVISLILHLKDYPRTGLSKQLAIVADAALAIENNRLAKAECISYEKIFEELKAPNNDFSSFLAGAAQYINDKYYKTESPKNGLLLLKHLQALSKAESLQEFNGHKETLIQALDITKPKTGIFFSSQPQETAIPKTISDLLEEVSKSLPRENITELSNSCSG